MQFVKKNVKKCIYSHEIANAIFNKTTWGDSPKRDYNIIDGQVAMEDAKNKGIIINGKLSKGTYYIFMWSKDHTRLIPFHVTMKRKTAENIKKGSEHYGSISIMNEILYDI